MPFFFIFFYYFKFTLSLGLPVSNKLQLHEVMVQAHSVDRLWFLLIKINPPDQMVNVRRQFARVVLCRVHSGVAEMLTVHLTPAESKGLTKDRKK